MLWQEFRYFSGKREFGTIARMKKITVKQVLVFLHMSGASGRDMLSGIFDYAKGCGRWSLHLANAAVKTADDVNALIVKGNIHGIIAGEYCLPNAPELLKDSAIPLVYISSKGESDYGRTKAVSYVQNDEEGIGRLAANTFLGCGLYRSFAFVPARPGVPYSDRRQNGYVRRLREAGLENVEIFSPAAPPGTPDDTQALAKWLAALPKPAAVYVGWDFRAIQVLEACRAAKISVPGQVAVLGTDNDELLCDSAEPPLSSILPDHERSGYAAAELLDSLMRGIRQRGISRRSRMYTADIRPCLAVVKADRRGNMLTPLGEGIGKNRHRRTVCGQKSRLCTECRTLHTEQGRIAAHVFLLDQKRIDAEIPPCRTAVGTGRKVASCILVIRAGVIENCAVAAFDQRTLTGTVLNGRGRNPCHTVVIAVQRVVVAVLIQSRHIGIASAGNSGRTEQTSCIRAFL